MAAALALVGPASEARAQDVVIPAQFEAAGNFHKGAAPAALDKRWGLIDRTGKWVVPPRYTAVGIGSEGLFPVQSEQAWGYMNAKGQPVIEPRFEAAEPFESGVAAVKLSGRWGYVRAGGAVETSFMFLEIGGREGDYVSARDAEGWAVFKLTTKGPPTRQAVYSDDDSLQRLFSVSEGSIIAKFRDEERMFLIDRAYSDGNPDVFTLTQRFPVWGDAYKLVSILRMTEGFAPAATAPNKWGYLHKASGEYLWQGRFEAARSFAHGLAPVKMGGKWGYIDRAGRLAVQPAYEAAFPFRGAYAVIRQGGKRGFLRLDPQGGISVFIAPRFEDALRFTEGLAPVKIDGRWGYVSDGQPWSELFDTGIVDIRPQ
jgi:hypothetical protein